VCRGPGRQGTDAVGAGEHPRLRRGGRVIVDTSVLLAIVFQEPGHERLIDEFLAADAVAAGTRTLAETGIVLSARLGSDAHGLVERLLDEFGIQEIPFGELHWREAVDAYRRYGKGRHSARLDFGDCMATRQHSCRASRSSSSVKTLRSPTWTTERERPVRSADRRRCPATSGCTGRRCGSSGSRASTRRSPHTTSGSSPPLAHSSCPRTPPIPTPTSGGPLPHPSPHRSGSARHPARSG
jgi:ribonuclease VapC